MPFDAPLTPEVEALLHDVTIIFADFESFYTQDYSLTQMDPASYILSPLFEAICLGVANLTDDPLIIDGPEIPRFILRLKQEQARGKRIAVVTHNAQFDVSILSWRYDFKPDLIIDTIALSRTVFGAMLRSHSLDSLASFLGLPQKGSMVKEVKGMARADIIANGMWEREQEYCKHDTWLCREVYKRLMPQVSAEEIVLHDMLTRCTTEPLLRVDRVMLQTHLAKVELQKAQTLSMVEQLGIGKSHLMSNNKFADVLRGLGVEPPMKRSPTTGEMTYAFSKQDQAFTDLLESENVMVRTVVEARLETKSTIEETRTKRFIAISELEFPNLGSCVMPMPVVIGAAHTHRVGGGWELNVQNMGRGSTLRDAIHAQPGYVLLVADSKQIEARDTAWFCDEVDLLEQFRRGEDVYKNFAAEVFELAVQYITAPQRFLGKTGILQLGYASGWVKFQNTVRVLSAKTDVPIILTDEESQRIVNKYRRKMVKTTGMWRQLDSILNLMHTFPEYGSGQPGVQMKCVTFYKNVMVGPTGLPIRFPNLHYVLNDTTHFGGGSWYFQDGRFERRTYGASLLETIAQHVARCIVFSAGVRLRAPMASIGARLVHSAHDELVYMVPEKHGELAKSWAELEFRRVPPWCQGLPLDVDAALAYRYGDAK